MQILLKISCLIKELRFQLPFAEFPCFLILVEGHGDPRALAAHHADPDGPHRRLFPHTSHQDTNTVLWTLQSEAKALGSSRAP